MTESKKFRSGAIVTEAPVYDMKDNKQRLAMAKAMTNRLDPVLKDIEDKAKAILIEAGYLTLAGKRKKLSLKKVAAMTDRHKDAQSAIWQLQALREFISKGDTTNTALSAILMTAAAWRAEIRLTEPVMKDGLTLRTIRHMPKKKISEDILIATRAVMKQMKNKNPSAGEVMRSFPHAKGALHYGNTKIYKHFYTEYGDIQIVEVKSNGSRRTVKLRAFQNNYFKQK